MSTDLDKAYGKAYRDKNRDKLRKQGRTYYKANKEKLVAYQKSYRQNEEFKEKKKQYYRTYMDNNREAILARRRELDKLRRKLRKVVTGPNCTGLNNCFISQRFHS